MIKVGPYKLEKPDHKITLCIMDDNSVSQRDYRNDRYTSSSFKKADFSSAFEALESLIQNYEK
jgi:hypothetical protein